MLAWRYFTARVHNQYALFLSLIRPSTALSSALIHARTNLLFLARTAAMLKEWGAACGVLSRVCVCARVCVYSTQQF